MEAEPSDDLCDRLVLLFEFSNFKPQVEVWDDSTRTKPFGNRAIGFIVQPHLNGILGGEFADATSKRVCV